MEYPWNNDEIFVTYFSSEEAALGVKYAAEMGVDLQNSLVRNLANKTIEKITFDHLKFKPALKKVLVDAKLGLTEHQEKAVNVALGGMLRKRRTKKQRYKKINK